MGWSIQQGKSVTIPSTTTTTTTPSNPATESSTSLRGGTDCSTIQSPESGIYTFDIYLNHSAKTEKEVLCDMETANGGWTVIQKRFDGSVDFYRTWTDYKNGFGQLSNEFWLGNDVVHAMTSGGSYDIRIDLWSFAGEHRFAEYNNFTLENEMNKYRFNYGRYSKWNGR